jgi:hypothetical protein
MEGRLEMRRREDSKSWDEGKVKSTFLVIIQTLGQMEMGGGRRLDHPNSQILWTKPGWRWRWEEEV